MSRSGYSDDCDDSNQLWLWRGAVASAMGGRRGQAFLREMLAAMDAMPEKRLVANELEQNGEVCAIGSVGRVRGIDMSKLDPKDPDTVASVFGIARAMAREIVDENDESYGNETPEQRWERMRRWVDSHIIKENTNAD
jgi:hypothetical protein